MANSFIYLSFISFTSKQGVEKPCSQAGQKGPRCEAREESTSGGVLKQYVGATPMGAEMISAAIERDYPKRLLSAGWRQMGLFQRSVKGNTINRHWVLHRCLGWPADLPTCCVPAEHE